MVYFDIKIKICLYLSFVLISLDLFIAQHQQSEIYVGHYLHYFTFRP